MTFTLAWVMLLAGCGCTGRQRGEPTPAPQHSPESSTEENDVKENTPDSAAALLAALADPDEQVRARAATALHERGHPRALEACLKTLDDAPDPLHLDFTPAVHCLRQIGAPALPPLLDALESGGKLTRVRALRVVQWVTKGSFGFDGRQWGPKGADPWFEWWDTIGYDEDAGPFQRREAVARLRKWLSEQS